MAGEQIKVVLEADSAKFEAAMKRASSIAQKFDNDIQKQNAGRTSGVGLPALELTPQSLRSLETASARAQDLARKTAQAGQSGKAGALGFLAFSQAVEDAQYGMKGVLNNIPQMILGFGGSAGLAGIFSLLAVAAYGAFQAIQKLSGLDAAIADAKAMTDAENAFTEALKKNRMEREALTAANERAQQTNTKSIIESGRVDSATTIDETALRVLEQKAEAIKRARAAQDAMISAAAGVKPADETAAQQGSREWEKAKADGLREERRLREDLATQQEYANKLASEYDRIRKSTAETDKRLTGEAAALVQPLDEARQRVRDMEADLARRKSMQDSRENKNSPGYRVDAKEIQYIEEKVRKEKEVIAGMQAEQETLSKLIEKTREQGTASLKTLEAKRRASQEASDLTREEIKGLNAKYGIEAKLITLRAAQARQGELEKNADKAAATAKTVQELADEIELTDEAIQQGGKKLQQLNDELAIRKRIKDLVASGMDPDAASRLVRADATSKKSLAEAMKKAAIDAMAPGDRADARRQASEERRAEARRAQEAEARAKRAEQKAERIAKEEERFPGRRKDGGIKPAEDAKQIAKDEAKRAADAAKARDENIKTQTDIQRDIKTYLEKLGAA